MRTDGTMKVAVFETMISFDQDKDAMLAMASLLGEAANWIRDESVKEVQISKSKRGNHRLYNIMMNTDYEQETDESGVAVRLILHYDDNEKG